MRRRRERCDQRPKSECIAAVHAGRIAVSPLHLDLTQHDGIGPLSMSHLERLLAPAVREFGD